MPHIRKKTSNRGSTNERKKILHKVRESRKKKAKAAKKNPQWKSKHKKDPGIPNNFPYKDQILAEVAEQRRQAAEEKQRRKDEKKAARAKVVDGGDEGSDEERATSDKEEREGSEEPFDGIVSLNAKRLVHAKTKGKEIPVEVIETEEEIPMLINHDLPNLKAVLDIADVVVEVLDARDPLSFRSSHLEELVAARPGQHILLILNKIDACPREAITSWVAHLRTQHPTILFRSSSLFLPAGPELIIKEKGKGKAKERVDDGLGIDSALACLSRWAQEKNGDEPLAVAVVGITNVGKSSFINSLLRRPVLPVYKLTSSSKGPTTTTLPQEVTLEVGGKEIRLIDTPGLSWEVDESIGDISSIRARDILMRNKGRIDHLRDPAPTIAHIVSRSDTEDLMLLYSLAAFTKGESESFLSGVARSHQLIKKRGTLDLAGASRIVLRDWSTGRFPRYATPPKASSAISLLDPKLADLQAYDEVILSVLKPRKEMRKSGGLVKFIAGEIESRKAVIEEPWSMGHTEGEEEDENDIDDEGDGLDDDEDEDDESDGEDGEDGEATSDDDDSPPPISSKQKRKRAANSSSAPPTKRVAFAADLKGSRQDGPRKGQTEVKPVLKSRVAIPKAKAPAPKVKQAKTSPAVVERMGKVANAVTKPKPLKASMSGGDKDNELYDFGKFF